MIQYTEGQGLKTAWPVLLHGPIRGFAKKNLGAVPRNAGFDD